MFGRNGEWLGMGARFFWSDENILEYVVVIVVHLVNILKTNQFCALKVWILCYVSYISITKILFTPLTE